MPYQFKIKNRICRMCKKEYTPTSLCQRFCGIAELKLGCSWKNQQEFVRVKNRKWYAYHKELSDLKNPPIAKSCLKCGTSFTTHIKHKIYCSAVCGRRFTTKSPYKPLRLRFNTLKKYNFTCQYCGRKPPQVKLHIDHILPKSKGGLDELENLIVACSDCNLGKSDVLLV